MEVNAEFISQACGIGLGFIVGWHVLGYIFQWTLPQRLKPAAFAFSRAILACAGCALCGWMCSDSFWKCMNDSQWWDRVGRKRLEFPDDSATSAYLLTGYEIWCLYMDLELPIYVFHHLLSSIVMYTSCTDN